MGYAGPEAWLYGFEATTTSDLALDLAVDEGDVEVLLELLDEPARELPDELAGFLREVLDPDGERTAPAGPSGWAGRTRRAPDL
jgi:hypothetical protein